MLDLDRLSLYCTFFSFCTLVFSPSQVLESSLKLISNQPLYHLVDEILVQYDFAQCCFRKIVVGDWNLLTMFLQSHMDH